MGRRYLQPFLAWSGAGLLIPLAGFSWMGGEVLTAALTAYLLSFVFTGSNYAVIRKINSGSYPYFYRIFLVSLALRFLLVLTVLYLALKVIKFPHIYFTVSFVISYIFHSVIEIIFLNKTLETETEF